MQKDPKFLVQFVHSIGDKQLFFVIWGALALFFVWLMASYYRKVTRRNFKPGSSALRTPTSAAISVRNRESNSSLTKK